MTVEIAMVAAGMVTAQVGVVAEPIETEASAPEAIVLTQETKPVVSSPMSPQGLSNSEPNTTSFKLELTPAVPDFSPALPELEAAVPEVLPALETLVSQKADMPLSRQPTPEEPQSAASPTLQKEQLNGQIEPNPSEPNPSEPNPSEPNPSEPSPSEPAVERSLLPDHAFSVPGQGEPLDRVGSGMRIQALEAQVLETEALGQVTQVQQLRDVQPTDWAYQALSSLVERYGCVAGYPDGTWRGDRTVSRYEFAAGLDACLNRVTEIISVHTTVDETVTAEDLQVVERLQADFQTELAQLQSQASQLEQRQAALEAQQFSTTTKLYGQAILGLRGSNDNAVDLFPRDGNPERSGDGDITLGGSAELTLATSFRGNDLLLTTLQAGNIAASSPSQLTNMGRLSYENDSNNNLVLGDLSYRFAVGSNVGVLVGPVGVNPTNTFRGISPLEGSGDGALSRLGQRNPTLELGSGTGGLGVDWQLSPQVSLQAVYSAALPSIAGEGSGLTDGRYVTGAQVAAGLGNNVDLGVHYLHSHSPDGALGLTVGDAQVLSPFAPNGSGFNTQAVGAAATWRLNPSLTLGGWGGWTRSAATEVSGSVETTNWMAFAQVNDLFRQGNSLGLLVGQPPKITASNLPVGYNFPEFANGGDAGGQEDTSLHVEAFYRAQISDHISITPGVVVVNNPNHNSANETLVVGAIRTTLRF